MHPRDETAPRLRASGHRRPGRHRDRHGVRRGDRYGVRQRAALLAGAVVLGACLTGMVVAVPGPRPDRAPIDQGEVPADQGEAGRLAGPSRPEQTGDARATSGEGEPSPTPAAAHPARGAVVRAADVLRAWDGRRAEAWAEGDAAALRDLYVDRAGVADVRLLRRYTDRGYRVEGLTTQLLAVEVLARAPGRWRLRVTDRVTSAVAVRGGAHLRLPRDGPDTHVVALVRGPDGRWRVARTRAA